MIYESPFEIGDKVYIDDDRDLVAWVNGVMWHYSDGHSIEVSWMHNGDSKMCWLNFNRLTRVSK